MTTRNRGYDAKGIAPALRRTREGIAKTGKSAAINVWVDRNEYAPETKNEGIYK
jgi:acetolactate synthase I/II/III large subunit